jgi:hypothetical protein
VPLWMALLARPLVSMLAAPMTRRWVMIGI